MTDYSKLKVTELKEELKNRNIPLVGCKVKQNYIDRLLEADGTDEASISPAATAAAGDEDLLVPDGAKQDDDSAVVASKEAEPNPTDESVACQPTKAGAQDSENNLETSAAVKVDQYDEKHVVDKESQASFAPEPQDPIMQPTPASTASDDRVNEPQQHANATSVNTSEASLIHPFGQLTSQPDSDRVNSPKPQAAQPSLTSTPSSDRAASAEILEDSKKRKRRSVTPPPSTQGSAQKRAKTSDGSPRVTQREGSILEDAPQTPDDNDFTTNGHELHETANREAPLLEGGPHAASRVEPPGPQQEILRSSPSRSPGRTPQPRRENDHAPEPMQEGQHTPLRSPAWSKPRSPNLLKRRSPSPPKRLSGQGRVVSPALHPATSSLYIRNFKRPLHIPSLRAHISAMAASPNTDAGSDTIVSWYLDSIRTHAFVSFHSIPAASRARSALHDSRFPDDMTREPLWVDFVPDEKIEEWIETEQNSNGGGQTGRRWEVVYQQLPTGIEAILQEVGSNAGARLAPQRKFSGAIGRVDSDIAGSTVSVPGVHPDRARLVPAEDKVRQRKEPALQQEPRPEQTDSGFRALDDLFPSTTAKPKLYYKAVDGRVAEERLDMLRDLRSLAGAKSGDPDMKRYTFELDRGREEWVDKGPEFGFGARGRAVGYRGRGGMSRGSETWRSGARY